MPSKQPDERGEGFLHTSGLGPLASAVPLALRPTNLFLAFAAVAAYFVYFLILESIWGAAGDTAETNEGAIRLPLACALDVAGPPWWPPQRPVLLLLKLLGFLVIWSFFGGAICRVAAVRFARGEWIGWRDALRYIRQRWVGGFLLGPLLPIGILLACAAALLLGGLVLAIPVFGDLVVGLGFVAVLVLGLCIAAMALHLVTSGHLIWPAIAVDAADGFDAVLTQAMAYVNRLPVRTIWYGLVAVVLGAMAWTAVNGVALLAAITSHGLLGVGASVFGFFERDAGGEPCGKLDCLWQLGGWGVLHDGPHWSSLAWFEYISAGLILLWVAVLAGLVWAYLLSYYHCATTVAYFLLRRDADGTDLQHLAFDETDTYESMAPAAPQPGTPD